MSQNTTEILGQFLEVMENIYLRIRTGLAEEGPASDLTMSQFRIITFLTSGPRRIGEVAAHLGISPSSATSVIDRLADKGLVTRVDDPGDRRVIRCSLTSMGEEQVKRFWSISTKRLESAARNLSLEEIGVLVGTLDTLLAVVRRQASEPDPGLSSSQEGGETLPSTS